MELKKSDKVEHGSCSLIIYTNRSQQSARDLEAVADNNTFIINLLVDELSFEHAKNRKLDFVSQDFFKKQYEDYNFICKFKAAQVFVEDEIEILKKNYREQDVDIYEKRIIEVDEKLLLIGEEIEEPDYLMTGLAISDISRGLQRTASIATASTVMASSGGSSSSGFSGGGGGGFSGGGGGGGGFGGR